MLYKKECLIGCICLFFIFSYDASTEVHIQSTPLVSGCDINIQLVSDIEIKEQNIDKQIFSRLEICDMGIEGSEGYPEIPVLRRLIEVPVNVKNVSFVYEVISIKEEKELLYPVYPVQPPWEKSIGKEKPKFIIYSSAYEQGKEYGKETITLEPFGVVRGKNLYQISYYPIHYIPSENKIFLRRNVNISVRWDNAKSLKVRDKKYESKYVDDLWKPLIVNNLSDTSKEKIESNYTIPTGMLVIVGSNFINSSKLNEWIQWKTQRGFIITVKNVADIGLNSTLIRNYIKQAYESWEIPPSFVVLVGDANYIPAQQGYAYYNPVTDLYYSVVDGDEYYTPDLWIGRISASTIANLDNAINKILQYEKAQWALSTPWYLKASFLTGVDHYEVTEQTHNYVITNYFSPKGFATQKLYTVTYNATTSDVLSAINEGRGWIVYSGHGSETEWQDGPAITQDNLNSLSNTVYPWVLSFACETGQFGRPECFGETWQRVPAGGVGFFGSSESSYWDEDDVLEKYIIQSFFENKTWTAGMILAGKLKFFNFYGNIGTTQYYFEMYNILGDPSTEIWIGELQNPVINYNISVSPDGLPFPLYIEWENASATLSNSTTLFGAGLTVFGNNLIQLSPPGLVPTVTLTVTGNPIYPIQVEIPVVPGSDGSVIWDKSVYTASSLAMLTLSDADLAGQQSIDLSITSTSGDSEQMQLIEKEIPGLFQGTIQLTTTNTGQNDGMLSVIHEGIISAEYYDEHTDEGISQIKVAEANIDAFPPELLQLNAFPSTRSSEFQIQTNENSNVRFEYGLLCSTPFPNHEESIMWTTDHKILLTGLTPDTKYFYRVTLVDRAGNSYTSDCSFFQTLMQPDYFTYNYQSTIVDTVPISYNRIVFTPDNSPDYYSACKEDVTNFMRDTGNATPITLGDDSFYFLEFPLGTKVYLYGTEYTSCYIGSNGYLTFTRGDNDYDESLERHFSIPRISLFFDDLNPSAGGSVIYQFEKDAFIVTYYQVMRYGSGEVNTQVELFYDGRIAITWLNCMSSSFIAGLSSGNGVPENLEISDFLTYEECKVLEGSNEGILEGEGIVEGSQEGEGIIEGTTEGIVEGEGVLEGEGIIEGFTEGEYIYYYSADLNRDGYLNLSELLRVVQFFNMEGYYCDINNVEDGYSPGIGDDHECAPYSADYNPQNWKIEFDELLRVIQIYNSGRYYPCPGQSEDNFCF
ncbi:MAG TPA: C25 family cysteine peptidase [Candidatus Hydrogenedens sp.]|nr:C25 family cysteine peptidase [Candidatus Hydrogenedens sp.]